MAPRCPKSQSQSQKKEKETPIPNGWFLASHLDSKGKVVKYYTNSLNEKFSTMGSLLRYTRHAKRQKISIYEPGFKPPPSADTGSKAEEYPHEAQLSKAKETEAPTAAKVKAANGEGTSNAVSQTSNEFGCGVNERVVFRYLPRRASAGKKGKILFDSVVIYDPCWYRHKMLRNILANARKQQELAEAKLAKTAEEEKTAELALTNP